MVMSKTFSGSVSGKIAPDKAVLYGAQGAVVGNRAGMWVPDSAHVVANVQNTTDHLRRR